MTTLHRSWGEARHPARDHPQRTSGVGDNDEGWSLHREPANQRGARFRREWPGGDLRVPSPSPRQERTGGVACVRSTRDVKSGCPRAGFGSPNLVWGTRFLEGRRGVGRGRGPAHVPRSAPSGEGVISAERSRKREAGEGAAALLLTPPWGGGSGSAQVPSLGRDRRVPGPPAPGAWGKERSGQGATRGRSHPVCAVGEGSAPWSPGHAAERGMHCTRNPGIPGSTRGTPSFQRRRLGLRQGVLESAARGLGRSPLPGHREKGGRRPLTPPPPRKKDVPWAARVCGREEGCLGHSCC